MEDVEKWLRENDLEDYIKVFTSQKINSMRRLLCLTNDIVKEFIPEGGPRAVFLDALQDLRRTKASEAEQPTRKVSPPEVKSGSALADTVGFVESSQPTSVTTVSDIIPIVGLSQSILIEVPHTGDLLDTDSGVGEAISDFSEPLSPAQSSSCSHVDDTIAVTKKRKRSTDSSLPSAKHLQSFKGQKHLSSLDLHKYFEENVSTSGIYDSYKESGCLNEQGRGIICQALADELLKNNKDPSPAEYQILVEKLESVFPEEAASVWYAPPVKKGGNASGKLYNKIRNLKLKYTLTNVKASSASSTSIDSDTQPGTSHPNRGRQYDQPAKLQGILNKNDSKIVAAISSLRHRSADSSWRELLACWSDTHALRHSVLIETRPQEKAAEGNSSTSAESDDSLPVNQYFREWSVLTAPNGYLLLNQDYDELYPLKKDGLCSKWDIYSKHIVELAQKEIKKSDVDSLHLLQSLKNIPADSQDPTILLILASIVCKRVRGKGSSKLPSVPEALNSFLLHVKIAGDLKATIRHHHVKLNKQRQTVQPLIVLVGPTLSQISASYLQIDGQRYKLRSPIAAVDACYKAFHALDARYPQDCCVLWVFIQHFFYDLRLEEDPTFSRVDTVSSSLRGLRKKCLEKSEEL